MSVGDVDRGGSTLHNHTLGEFAIGSVDGRLPPACLVNDKPSSVNPTCIYPHVLAGASKTGNDTSPNEEKTKADRTIGYGGPPKMKGAG